MPLSRFTKLALTTLLATIVLIGLGGYVRAMEAGLGCPDWPKCFGELNPPAHLAPEAKRLAWIEHSHRLWAGGLIVLVVVMAAAAWWSRQRRSVRWTSVALVPTILLQAVIGAIVVKYKLKAESVTLHLAGALAVLGLTVYVIARSWPLETVPVASRVRRLARGTAAVVFLQMMVGSTVAGFEAGLSYTTFPGYDGSLLPAATTQFRPWLHVGHRLLAYGVAAMVVALAVRSRRTGLRRLTLVAAGLVGVQIVLGALNIWYRIPAWSVVPHLVVGALIWATTLLVALQAREGSDPGELRADAAPALESVDA